MAPTDHRLGRPLPYQLPNQPLTHPKALLLRHTAFQRVCPIRVYPQFPEAIPDLWADYQRVTKQSAGPLRAQDLHGLVQLK